MDDSRGGNHQSNHCGALDVKLLRGIEQGEACLRGDVVLLVLFDALVEAIRLIVLRAVELHGLKVHEGICCDGMVLVIMLIALLAIPLPPLCYLDGDHAVGDEAKERGSRDSAD